MQHIELFLLDQKFGRERKREALGLLDYDYGKPAKSKFNLINHIRNLIAKTTRFFKHAPTKSTQPGFDPS